MSHLSRTLVVTLALTCASLSAAQTSDVCATVRSARAAGSTKGNVTPAEVCRVLSVLAHDSLEGRGTGSVGGARAARFIAEDMRRVETAATSSAFRSFA